MARAPNVVRAAVRIPAASSTVAKLPHFVSELFNLTNALDDG
jgi:hypothetical protein